MTTTQESPHPIPVRLDFDAHAGAFSRAVAHLDHAATKELDQADFDPGCASWSASAPRNSTAAPTASTCTPRTPARSARPSSGYSPAAWSETPYFTARERAALAFTEAVTRRPSIHVPDAAYDAAAEQFSPDELAALVSLIVAINAWNAIGVSTPTWVPGSYS